jgi:hypothetical protein
MTNRREVLRAAAALPLMTGAIAVARPIALHSVLVDARHAGSRRVGSRLAVRGATVQTAAHGDITQVWLTQIGPAWRRGPAAVAGLTERPALFCLEQLALASGMRVVFHAEHVVRPGGDVEHRLLRGAQAANLSARDLVQAGPLWPDRVADAITFHRENSVPVRFGRSDSALEPLLPAGSRLLTSWIIAAA